jgi:hypothetical protein
MSKTNDTSKLGRATLDERRYELTIDELDAVVGGVLLLSNVLKMLEDTNKAIIGNIR